MFRSTQRFFDNTSGGTCCSHSDSRRSILRAHTLIKNRQKLRSIRTQSLNGMRVACREDPQIAFANVADEHGSIRVHHSDAGMAVKNISPLIGGVRVQFAVAACGETHVDAGDIFRRREDTLRDLVSPSTLFHALLHQIEGVPYRPDVAVIRRRGSVRKFGFSFRSALFSCPGSLEEMVVFCLLGALPLLSIGRPSSKCGCQSRRTHSKKPSS
jgi:hypothetical protein